MDQPMKMKRPLTLTNAIAKSKTMPVGRIVTEKRTKRKILTERIATVKIATDKITTEKTTMESKLESYT